MVGRQNWSGSGLDLDLDFEFGGGVTSPVAGSLVGIVSRNLFTSFSVRAFIASEFFCSLVETAAISIGVPMTYGVRKISTSVFWSVLTVCRNSTPRSGISPRNGILVTDSALAVCIRPPMTTVCALGVTTTVSAERVLMTGALTVACPVGLLAMGTHCDRSCTKSEVSGERIISTKPSAV